MRHRIVFFPAIVIAAATIAFAASKTVTVLVKQTSIRADKQFFAKTIATANRLDELELIETQGGWLKVNFKGKTGWVHASAISVKKAPEKKKGGFSLFGKEDDPAKVSQDEVAMAGKGFNEQVEDSYKKKNPKLDFAAVDKMEKVTADQDKLAAFVKDGNLESRELKVKK